jgi:predicted transcriptional regulator
MPGLTKRVQILLSPEQFSRLQEIAKTEGESLGALIRKALEEVYLEREQQDRLAAVREMAALRLPVADWEQMERESIGAAESV